MECVGIGAGVAVRGVRETDAAAHTIDDALARVELEVGLLHDLGDGADGFETARADRDEHEQLRQAAVSSVK